MYVCVKNLRNPDFFFAYILHAQLFGSVAIRISTTPEEIRQQISKEFIIPFFKQLPDHLKNCKWHVSIEGNHSFTETGLCADIFTQYGPAGRVYFAAGGSASSTKIGPWTTNDTKQNSVDLIHSHLDSHTIYLCPHYFGEKSKLYNQLIRVRRIVERKKTHAGPVFSATISGKIRSAVKVETQDDMAISFLIAIYGATAYLQYASVPQAIAERWSSIHAQRQRVFRSIMRAK
jgi:hypothetical protein